MILPRGMVTRTTKESSQQLSISHDLLLTYSSLDHARAQRLTSFPSLTKKKK